MKLRSAFRKIHFLILPLSLGCFIFLGFCRTGSAQEKTVLKEVKIAGNLRVEEDGIRLHVKNRPGQLFDQAVVEQDVKAIYRMGFFEDVQAEISPDGVLTYTVKEKPYVREIKIEGNAQLSRDKIETALGVTPRTILDRGRVAEGVDKVRKLYNEQGYVNAKVDYALSVESSNQAVLVVDIVEGNRLLIKKVSFEGNRSFSEGELKGLMATKEEWLFSFITNRGVLDRDILTNDMAILSNHYYDHGYIDLKVAEPVILRDRDGLEVVIRIDEGQQYRVGKVEIGGELIQDGRQMLKQVKLTSGQIFRGSRLRDDVSTITDMYSNKGFAFVQVEPLTKVNPPEKTVDVALIITKGPPVYFNRILIAGNTKTRDKVVRRELEATEQELFSGSKVTQSRNALQRTGYFEDVQLTTKKTEQPDTVDLLVDVKEGPTGTFSVGAGYSGGDGFLFNASVAEKNLFGRGQTVKANVSLGTERQDFILSYNEPYLNDTKVALGVDAFNTETVYTDFKERRLGMAVRSSYPFKDVSLPFFGMRKSDVSIGSDELNREAPITIWDYMRGSMAYELTREKISDVEAGAPASIRDEVGTSLTSAITPGISYDSRDHFFNPTEGTKSAFAVKFAGLGGDSRFIKSDIGARWYYPLLKDPKWGGSYVFSLGGTLGYGFGFNQPSADKNELPLFERYFPGGINSVRGFQDRSLGPKEDGDVVGGDKQAIANVEIHFPVAEQFGLRGLAFFDIGQAFKESSSWNFSDFRRSVGFGARWMSPFGPLRVELGFPLNKQPGDETSVLGFSVGSQP
ncbi:MAG TPA: outer membrane protein assembly factor BamA [Candidatus Binatia bacterium]|nr:outer membrane protein assembly factor BamA [Candidatus Binatia bacterium]